MAHAAKALCSNAKVRSQVVVFDVLLYIGVGFYKAQVFFFGGKGQVGQDAFLEAGKKRSILIRKSSQSAAPPYTVAPCFPSISYRQLHL